MAIPIPEPGQHPKQPEKLVFTPAEIAEFDHLVRVSYDGSCLIDKCDLVDKLYFSSFAMEVSHRTHMTTIVNGIRANRSCSRSKFSQLLSIMRRYVEPAKLDDRDPVDFSVEIAQAERLLLYANEKAEASVAHERATNVKYVDQFSTAFNLS